MPQLPTRPLAVPTVSLADLAAECDLTLADATSGRVEIHGISLASGTCRPGDLFVALAGAAHHGIEFAPAALAAGARAILTDPDAARQLPPATPCLVSPAPRAHLGPISAAVYGRPAERLTSFGVTGTNGKTTVVFFLEHLLRALGRVPGMLGTVHAGVGETISPAVLTTPQAPELQALLAAMVELGADSLAMEVSSHALATGRVDAVRFDVAGFTNLSHDHLDFHADIEDYFRAKARLFTPPHARRGVVVLSDGYARRLVGEAGVPVARLALNAEEGEYRLGPIDCGRAELLTPQGTVPIAVTLPGDFNVVNAALAVAMALEGGVDAAALGDLLRSGPLSPVVPGRMEIIAAPAGAPRVVVDFAHNPGALRDALTALRGSTPGRLHLVFGATGDRDRAKRPEMGEVAARLADVVWLTDDDPHSEDRAAIRAGVRAGMDGGQRIVEVAEREEAIVRAIAEAAPGDTVLIAGRGHETIQEIAGVDHVLDDRAVARRALRDWAAGDPA